MYVSRRSYLNEGGLTDQPRRVGSLLPGNLNQFEAERSPFVIVLVIENEPIDEIEDDDEDEDEEHSTIKP